MEMINGCQKSLGSPSVLPSSKFLIYFSDLEKLSFLLKGAELE